MATLKLDLGTGKRKSCQRCRRIKVKCVFESPDAPCLRCQKAKVDCRDVVKGMFSNKKDSPVWSAHGTDTANAAGGSFGEITALSSPKFDKQKRLKELASIIESAHMEYSFLKGEAYQVAARVAPGTRHMSSPYLSPDSVQSVPTNSAGPSSAFPETNSTNSTESANWRTGVMPWLDVQSRGGFPMEALKSDNNVQAAIDLGLLTKEEADTFHCDFINHLSIFMTFPVNRNYTGDSWMIDEPLYALSTVVAAATVSKHANVFRLSQLLERTCLEKLYIEGNMTYDVLKAFFVQFVFVQFVPPKKIMLYALNAACLCLALQKTADQHIKVMRKQNRQDPEFESSHWHLRIIMHYYACLCALTLNVSHFDLMGLVPGIVPIIDTMTECGDDLDKIAVCQIRLSLITREVMSKLQSYTTGKILPPEEIRRTLVDTKARLEDELTKTKQFAPFELKEGNGLKPIDTTMQQLWMFMNEHAMNQIMLYGLDKDSEARDILMSCAQNIIQSAWNLVDIFLDMCNRGWRFPKYMFFRPIQAVCGLIRVNMVVMAAGERVETNASAAFEQIKRAWQKVRQHSYSAELAYPMYVQVEKWLNLKSRLNNGLCDTYGQQQQDRQQGQPPTTALITRILKDVLLNVESPRSETVPPKLEDMGLPDTAGDDLGNPGIPLGNVDAGFYYPLPVRDLDVPSDSSPSSEGDVELLIKELFSEIVR
ncbi:hypothetical protein TRVA0_007S03884 [Trichomonascus vanleenenianus]|uniref:Zn(II)2Cys6 transcription factor domain-containing protein n=1 Tax=Trichomonascus vanleenenianus TaxID=2268995 RepID=UPI003ECAFE44